MSEEREMLFVNDCFECFEKEGFAKKFWSPFGDDKERIGQSFKVVGRCSTKDSDLSSLPMWNRKRMSIGGHRINKSFNRMEEFCGNTDFLKGRN